MWKPPKLISVTKLDVDQENFRIGSQPTQEAAIRAMIEEQGPRLVRLARDIGADGLSPAEALMVIPSPTAAGRFVVLDGNRRVTALKLLAKPALAKGTRFAAAYGRAAAKYKDRRPRKVQCSVFASRGEADPWITRRHAPDLGGRGHEHWTSVARQRQKAAQGRPIHAGVVILDYAERRRLVPDEVHALLSRNRSTNVQRLFQARDVTKALGIRVTDGRVLYGNGDREAGDALVARLLQALAEPKQPVSGIINSKAREIFLKPHLPFAVLGPFPADQDDGLDDLALVDEDLDEDVDEDLDEDLDDGEADESGEVDGRSEAASAGGAAGNGNGDGAGSAKADAAGANSPQDRPARRRRRQKLAAASSRLALAVPEGRLARLYDEAQKLNVVATANCGAFLTRVFVELSTELFLDAFVRVQDHFPPNFRSWSYKGIALGRKVEIALGKLEAEGPLADLEWVRRAVSDSNALHSIDTLHQYIHNRSFNATPEEILETWDRWHPFLERLFHAVAEAAAESAAPPPA